MNEILINSNLFIKSMFNANISNYHLKKETLSGFRPGPTNFIFSIEADHIILKRYVYLYCENRNTGKRTPG